MGPLLSKNFTTTIMTTKKSTVIAFAAVILTASAFGFTGIASANTNTTPSSWKSTQKTIKDYLKHAPGVVGKVQSIAGNSIIVTSSNNTTYTIDITDAKIFKNRNTVISINDVNVGDTLMIQGTFNGTTVTANTIFDGKGISGKKYRGNFPGVMGIVSSVGPTTFTVTTKDSVAYTVTTTSATKITTGSSKATALISDIVNGDTVMVRGTITGHDVLAKSIFDVKVQNQTTTQTSTN